LINDITSAQPPSGEVFENQTTGKHGEHERTYKQGKKYAVCANLRRSLGCRDLVSREDGRHPILRIDSYIVSGTARQPSFAI
jgi:hypothetical protein